MGREYLEKLKDPRWQQKRLRILERDGWMCQSCAESERTLHVHHLRYDKGREPWDVPDEWLITLCDECHSRETTDRKALEWELVQGFRHLLNCDDLEEFVNDLTWAVTGPDAIPSFARGMGYREVDLGEVLGWVLKFHSLIRPLAIGISRSCDIGDGVLNMHLQSLEDLNAMWEELETFVGIPAASGFMSKALPGILRANGATTQESSVARIEPIE